MLRILVDLQIETDDGKRVEVNVPLRFDNGICWRQTENRKEVDVEVEVTWYPEVKMAPEVVYTIRDELSYTAFIGALRRLVADHADREDILDRHNTSILSSTGEHPVLAKQRAEQPARWIHIKLQAVKGEETLSTTLIMRDDNLYVCGFMNQQGDSFELIENPDRSTDVLPVDEYSPLRLSWGVGYRSILEADYEHHLARRLENASILGRDFAMDAVYVLSRFPAWVDDRVNPRNSSDKQMNPRLALAGLIIMVCESARMNPVNKFIARQWNKKMYANNNLMHDMFNYGRSSGQLLTWKSKGYDNPCPISQLQDIYLVLNYRLDHSPQSSYMNRGRPRAELLAMSADLGVKGMTVIVFDGKRGRIIYRKKEQGEKGTMVDLVLTGPYTSISAYGCFAIKIDIPPQGGAAGSSKGDGTGSIKWEWDCYDPKYADEVDKPPVSRKISSGPGRNVVVTYAVMSNALEATVQVKLRMKDGNCPCSVHGLITARIGNFEQQSIILFSHTEKTAQRFPPTADSPQVVLHQLVRSLELARNVVAVPCGQKLDIKMADLNIETYKNQGTSNQRLNDIILSFDGNSSLSKRCKLDDGGDEVEVNVAWYPGRSPARQIREQSQRQPDISYVVRRNDGKGFSAFITELRSLVVEQRCCKDLMANHPVHSSTRNHPVLPKEHDINNVQRDIEPDRLFHIKLQVEERRKTSTITLVMRDDNMDVITFINKDGDYCSQLGDPGDRKAPDDTSRYRFTIKQDWSKGYGSIVETRGQQQVENILRSAKLGVAFAADAVHMLSDYPYLKPTDNPYEALLGLMVMIGDSARMEPVRKSIEGGWDNGTALTEELKGYRRNWTVISGALLDWSDRAYPQEWPQNTALESIGITSSEAAREVVHLVFNDENRICAY